VATVALVASGFANGVASAVPDPANPCPDAFPVVDLVAGMVATGLTVEKGNVADPFTATVVGVIADGIAPGVDMIIVDTDSPAIQRAGGVWAGMSGSPVYAPDGRLIGAVAYGLSFGPSKIAGVTPAADMKALLTRPVATPRPAAKVARPAQLRQRLVASGAATSAEASSGMRQLPIPLAVSGINQGHLGKVAEQLGGAGAGYPRVRGRCGRGRRPRLALRHFPRQQLRRSDLLRRPDSRRRRHDDRGMHGRGRRTSPSPSVIRSRSSARRR
jgi:hypothetical protein